MVIVYLGSNYSLYVSFSIKYLCLWAVVCLWLSIPVRAASEVLCWSVTTSMSSKKVFP